MFYKNYKCFTCTEMLHTFYCNCTSIMKILIYILEYFNTVLTFKPTACQPWFLKIASGLCVCVCVCVLLRLHSDVI